MISNSYLKKKSAIIQLFHTIAERGYQMLNNLGRESGRKYLKKIL